jgi:hypothetical protein
MMWDTFRVASVSSACELNHTSIQIRSFLDTNVKLVAMEMIP